MKKLLLLLIFPLLFSTTVFAQVPASSPTEYKLLQPLPGVETTEGSGKSTATSYIRGLFILMISIAGVLSVVMIIFGGIKYMSTDAFTGKGDAKTTIQNALWGLLLAIGAWLILFSINRKLVEFDLSIVTLPQTATTTPVAPTLPGGTCTGCVQVGVTHKSPPQGCAPTLGRCVVAPAVNTKLLALKAAYPQFLVTEAYPPTRAHANPCHQSGTCVDATLTVSSNPENIKNFINRASGAGFNAVFETTSEQRADFLRKDTGLSATQIRYVPGITGEHFSLY